MNLVVGKPALLLLCSLQIRACGRCLSEEMFTNERRRAVVRSGGHATPRYATPHHATWRMQYARIILTACHRMQKRASECRAIAPGNATSEVFDIQTTIAFVLDKLHIIMCVNCQCLYLPTYIWNESQFGFFIISKHSPLSIHSRYP